jgi:hypothetical protein
MSHLALLVFHELLRRPIWCVRMSDFDIENFVPKYESIAVHQLAAFLSISAQHVRHLIEDGSLKVPDEELARVRHREKPWTIVRVPRESVIEFVRQRMLPHQRKARQKGSRGGEFTNTQNP